jgi:hypothetical protein
LIYHNELARLLEVSFSDHERLARLEAEADFAEITPENLAVVRERFRYSLVSMRGKIERQVRGKKGRGANHDANIFSFFSSFFSISF